MIYDGHNVARNTKVFDVESKAEMRKVVAIDVGTGEVECFFDPLEVTASGDLATFKIKFSAIHPIRGGAALPCLFHCYGRQT